MHTIISPRATRNTLLVIGVSGIFLSAASTAAPPSHARPVFNTEVPVEVVNGSDKPVPVELNTTSNAPLPVKESGRTPYQMVYHVSSLGTGDQCSNVIPVPADKTLTITNIGVTASQPSVVVPTVYLRVSRSSGGVSSDTQLSEELRFTGTKNQNRFYSGNYNVNIFAGNASDGASFTARMCITANAEASGIISGYVEESEIIDGNSL